MTDANATELVVVRHGETEWNATGKQQGHLDSPLTDTGLRQAEAIADALAARSFDLLYSSDLGRAYHTAERIAAKTGHEIITEPRLRERHLGVFQGLTMAEVAEKLPEAYAGFTSGDPCYVIPGGESERQRYERIVGCVDGIAARHEGRRVVIVTHGGALTSLFRRAMGLPLGAPRTFSLFNASINTFHVTDGRWKLGTWGDTSHLKGIPTADDW
jgi:probable phosphoglycerate mutase